MLEHINVALCDVALFNVAPFQYCTNVLPFDSALLVVVLVVIAIAIVALFNIVLL